jgi:hypothetical protein
VHVDPNKGWPTWDVFVGTGGITLVAATLVVGNSVGTAAFFVVVGFLFILYGLHMRLS